jgi:hypothetical protein
MRWIFKPVIALGLISSSMILSGCGSKVVFCDADFQCSEIRFDCAGCQNNNKFDCTNNNKSFNNPNGTILCPSYCI